jgi:hypothetical protein
MTPSRFLLIGILATLGAAAAFGQVSAVRAGSFEIGPFIGASYGIDKFRVMGGGNITYALKNKYVLPYFEYSYLPWAPPADKRHDPGRRIVYPHVQAPAVRYSRRGTSPPADLQREPYRPVSRVRVGRRALSRPY